MTQDAAKALAPVYTQKEKGPVCTDPQTFLNLRQYNIEKKNRWAKLTAKQNSKVRDTAAIADIRPEALSLLQKPAEMQKIQQERVKKGKTALPLKFVDNDVKEMADGESAVKYRFVMYLCIAVVCYVVLNFVEYGKITSNGNGEDDTVLPYTIWQGKPEMVAGDVDSAAHTSAGALRLIRVFLSVGTFFSCFILFGLGVLLFLIGNQNKILTLVEQYVAENAKNKEKGELNSAQIEIMRTYDFEEETKANEKFVPTKIEEWNKWCDETKKTDLKYTLDV